jgi:hypothetical protein
VVRHFGTLRRFEDQVGRGWTAADTELLIELVDLPAPGAWTPLPGAWSADVAKLQERWSGATPPPAGNLECLRELGRTKWAERTPPGADAPPDTGLDPRDVLLALLLPDLAPMVLRER